MRKSYATCSCTRETRRTGQSSRNSRSAYTPYIIESRAHGVVTTDRLATGLIVVKGEEGGRWSSLFVQAKRGAACGNWLTGCYERGPNAGEIATLRRGEAIDCHVLLRVRRVGPGRRQETGECWIPERSDGSWSGSSRKRSDEKEFSSHLVV